MMLVFCRFLQCPQCLRLHLQGLLRQLRRQHLFPRRLLWLLLHVLRHLVKAILTMIIVIVLAIGSPSATGRSIIVVLLVLLLQLR